mgnify:CR=1 FL=1
MLLAKTAIAVTRLKQMKRRRLLNSILLVGIVVIFGCDRPSQPQANVLVETVKITPPELYKKPKAIPYTTEAKLMAVGDIMMHGTQIK